MGAATSSVLQPAWLAPALVLYQLCCWPGGEASESDTNSDKSSSRRGVTRHESGSHRRASEFFSRRMGSSAVSLHLPSTSGGGESSLSAHRSHEEIARRVSAEEARYHSAPSVIREVLHRRDWDCSARDLYIPLKPERDVRSITASSPEAPRAEAESSSIEERTATRPCKKHHSNTKRSRAKEHADTDDKDRDATEIYSFYIGDNDYRHDNEQAPLQAKLDKQSFNESLRRAPPGVLDDVIACLDTLDSPDRSGAAHHTLESRHSLAPHPPPSVETVGYEGGACYLAETGVLGPLRPRAPGPGPLRARHASDGDILAPHLRPESGAFSESDLELETEAPTELPPPYEELHPTRAHDKKETAI